MACFRYIPTPVGRLQRGGSWTVRMPVHPHACGEIVTTNHYIVWINGTSPRLWGDLFTPPGAIHQARYIPTPVGRFFQRACYYINVAVHPHACGEIPQAGSGFADINGTSPRLWGDWAYNWLYAVSGWYIPTPVGRLITNKTNMVKFPVHPHACGEILLREQQVANLSGTSPRLWGDCSQSNLCQVITRYIPTPVGRLVNRCVHVSPVSVHPHACGEIRRAITKPTTSNGTSPRLWGDCRVYQFQTFARRYIPTPVGRFTSSYTGTPHATVHPHACGEIHSSAGVPSGYVGTSPRLWGD